MSAVDSLSFYEKPSDSLNSYVGFILTQYQRNTGTLIDENGLFKILGVSKQAVSCIEGFKDLLKQNGLYKTIFQ